MMISKEIKRVTERKNVRRIREKRPKERMFFVYDIQNEDFTGPGIFRRSTRSWQTKSICGNIDHRKRKDLHG